MGNIVEKVEIPEDEFEEFVENSKDRVKEEVELIKVIEAQIKEKEEKSYHEIKNLLNKIESLKKFMQERQNI